MNAAFRLGGAILVDEADKATLSLETVAQPLGFVPLELPVFEVDRSVLWDGNGVLCISKRWVALSVERVVQNLVMSDVVERIFEGPMSERVAVAKPAFSSRSLKHIDPSPLGSLPSGSTSDDDLCLEILKTSLERLYFADLVVLADVSLPKIGTVNLIKHILGFLAFAIDALSHREVSFKTVSALNVVHESESLVEQVESVDKEDWHLLGLEIAESIQQMGDHAVASDHGIWEHDLRSCLDCFAQCIQSLLLKMLQSHELALLLKSRGLRLVPHALSESHADGRASLGLLPGHIKLPVLSKAPALGTI